MNVHFGIELVIFVQLSWWFSPLFLALTFLSERMESQRKLLFYREEMVWFHQDNWVNLTSSIPNLQPTCNLFDVSLTCRFILTFPLIAILAK